MRIAVFHSFLDNIGGAEIVALTLARELKADIYTTNINEEKISKMGFAELLPRIKSIGKVPTNAPLRQQLTFWKFRRLNLGKQYDFYIIAGDWAMSGAVNNQPNLWYIHSPLNELWQFKNYIRQNILNWWKRPIFDVWVWWNRKLTLKYAKYVKIWVCNSQNTQNRIKKFYKTNAEIIYPPTDVEKYSYKENGDFWLSVNRLAKNKRIELQFETFRKLPNEKLTVVGSYEKGARQFESYKKYLETIKPDNVEVVNWVDKSGLFDLYSKCKGFITTANDEDFGMTVVEAMASGKPVIAPNNGGYKESITSETGILLDDINEEKIVGAIKKINTNPLSYKEACIKRAQIFNTNNFIVKIKQSIKS